MKNFARSGGQVRIASVLHLYQRTEDGFLLFYDTIDFLVVFSIICVEARRNKIQLLGVCLMFDHIHSIATAGDRKEISPFMRGCSCLISRELNVKQRRDCPVCLQLFGCAVKKGDKSIRTTLSYLYNNPGEKLLCRKAEEYRWNFLAYAKNDHPFSAPIKLNKASKPLRRAIRMINYYFSHGKYLRHGWLENLFQGLCFEEKEQLTDYIITKYNCIDYEALISFYGSYEMACLAFESNQGSEYEIKEDFSRDSHRPYLRIEEKLRNLFRYDNPKEVLLLPEQKRETLAKIMVNKGELSWRQAHKYFRIPWRSNN